MADTTRIKVDFEFFLVDAKRLLRDNYPNAVANAFRMLSKRLSMFERARTRQTFKLHSEFIPREIRAYPTSTGQLNKIKRDVRDTHEAFASVYVGDKALFMSRQEFGGTREPLGKALTVPQSDYKMHTSGGRIKARYLPEKVLKDYEQTKYSKNSKHPGVYGSHQRKAFILKTANGTVIIARRKGRKRKPLRTLYVITPRGKIKEKWDFETTGKKKVEAIYQHCFNIALKKLST